MRRGVCAVFLLACVWPLSARAQEEVVGTLAGSIQLGDSRPDSGWVTLHLIRVEPELSGPIDSTRVEADGSFQFELPALPDPGGQGEVYFVSMRWDGVLYFGDPLARVIQLDDEYEIRVYPAKRVTDGEQSIRVIHRSVVFDRVAPGWRIVEQIVVRNVTDSTLVTGVDGLPTFTHPLVAGAVELEVGESSLSPDAVAIVDGLLWIAASIPPGDREYFYQYFTADSAFSFPGPAVADSLDLFISEPAPELRVEGLAPRGSIAEGPRAYRAWRGSAQTEPFRIEPGVAPTPDSLPVRGIVAVIALVLAVAAIMAMSSRPRPAPGQR